MTKVLFDIKTECAVLGVLLDGRTDLKKIARLHIQSFTTPRNQKIFKAIQHLIDRKIQISPENVLSLLSQNKTNEEIERIEDSLSEIYECRRGHFFNTEENIKKLNDLALKRSFQTVPDYFKELQENKEIKTEEAAQNLIKYIQNILNNTEDTSQGKTEIIKKILQEYQKPIEPTGTGLESLDSIFEGGFVRGRTYGVGGKYGRGKTTLMGTISQNINDEDVPHLVISLETPPEDIEIKSVARSLGITSTDITDGKKGLHEKFIRNTELISEHIKENTYYEYVQDANIEQIIELIKKHVYLHNIQGVMIDYLQLINLSKKGLTYQEKLNHISNRICNVCRKEKIWGLIMVQTKGAETKYDDLIGILQPFTVFINMIRESNDQGIYFYIEKNKHGPTGFVGSEGNPAAIFDFEGPYIRDRESDDIILEKTE